METVLEFVIDLSGSMQDKIGLTKEMLLSDIIPNLDYSSKIGIKSFSGVQGLPPVVQELPLSLIDKDGINTAINKLIVKNGGTPISEAIRQSVITLKEYSASNKKIILVTDGEEDKGGDYVAECKKAQIEGINCEIHVVGIGLNSQAQSKAEEISKLTNGTFSNIPFKQGTTYNQSTIKANLSNLYSATLKPVTPIQPVVSSIPLSQPIINTATIAQPVNNSISKEQPQESSSNIEQKVADIEEIKPAINEDVNSDDKSGVLGLIIQEIKEIKKELKSLKTDKKEVPEIAEDAEFNESIRVISESYLNEYLNAKYPNRVNWLNKQGESNLDHDFEILEEDGSVEYYIECKGTAKQKPTFYMTKNEWKLFLNNTRNYQIYFIQDVFTSPSHIFISNVLDWLLKGKLLPYLKSRDIIKEERVFLTISDSQFIK